MKKIIYGLILSGVVVAAFFVFNRSSGAQNKETVQESVQERISPEAARQMGALAQEKMSRTAAQKKIDSNLLYKIKMERGERIADGVNTLETGLTVDEKGYIEVDIVADVTRKLRKRLKAVKAKIIVSLPEYRSITASVPISAVESLAELNEVYFISPRQKGMTQKNSENRTPESPAVGIGDLLKSPTTYNFADRAANVRDFLAAHLDGDSPNTGSVNSQGDITHQANIFRAMTGANGAGIKIGVMSDGVDTLATQVASGDLPPNVTVLPGQANTGDEGTAMLEIVHDIAPGAQLYYATASTGLVQFAQNIRNLRAAGCTIIIDDLGYANEASFQNGQAANVISNNNGGVVIQAINDVTVGSMAGALYFSSAANSGNKNDGTSGTWEGDFVDAGPAGGILQGAGNLHNFGGGSVINTITASGGGISLKWSDPLGASANDYDVFVVNSTGTQVVGAGTNMQTGTQDAFEFINSSTANTAGNSIVIAKFSGAARYLRLDGNRNRLNISTAGSTTAHNAGINTISIAATPTGPAVSGQNGSVGPFPNPFNSSNSIEKFSSDGPHRIFFNADGTAITPGNVSSTGGQLLQKPDMTAADGNSTNRPQGGLNPFFGTSAAAPHAGALAALVKSACPSATNEQIYNAFFSTAIDIEAPGIDRDSGAGIMMPIPAKAALCTNETPSTIQFSTGNYSVNENGGVAAITVTRTGGTAAASVNYATSNGTATAGSDYQATNGTLNFAANENTKTFNVTIIDDAVPETNETVNLTLGSPVGATLGTPATAVLTIIDNDVSCNFQLNPASSNYAAAGGSGAFQVITPAGCPWSTTVSASFASNNDEEPTAPVTVFNNPAPITISDRATNSSPPGLGSLYPSNIAVSGLSGTISQVRVTINGLTHTFPDDVDILLVGPGGQRTILMSDAGGDPNVSGVNLTFDQNAADSLPDFTTINSGTYRPTNYVGNSTLEPGGIDDFPAPAPGQANYNADLNVFNGTTPNGTWQLYVVDDEVADTGGITGGWSLDVTTGGSTGSWITVTSGATGNGNGSVGFSVAANPGANSRTGTITVGGQVHTVSQAGTTTTTARRAFDFDGDGKADVSVFRPSTGIWYLLQSQNGFTGVNFGLTGDLITPADYDGDGKTDVAVFRNGTWYLQRSQLGFTGISFGSPGDIPMPADYDGDGKADVAVFRPSSGIWYILRSQLGFTGVQFGATGDQPVAADYDGDNKADVAVFRPSSGIWYILRSQLGFTGVQFGATGDLPVPADYDGDNKADVAVFRPSTGTWYLNRSQLGFTGIGFGSNGDRPAAADYDGDNKADVAVFRPSTGTWYLLRSTAGFTGVAFGSTGDQAVPAAFVP